MADKQHSATNPFPQRTDKLTPHKHQFTVPVEWHDTNFGPVIVTKLRCNGCSMEIDRDVDRLPKEIS